MSRRRKLRNQWENNAATTHFSWVVAQNLVSWKLSWQDWQMLSFNISLQFNGSALFKKKKKNTFYLTITLNFPNNLDTCTSALEKYIYSHNWYHRALKSDTSSVQHSSDSNVSFGRVETFTVDVRGGGPVRKAGTVCVCGLNIPSGRPCLVTRSHTPSKLLWLEAYSSDNCHMKKSEIHNHITLPRIKNKLIYYYVEPDW